MRQVTVLKIGLYALMVLSGFLVARAVRLDAMWMAAVGVFSAFAAGAISMFVFLEEGK